MNLTKISSLQQHSIQGITPSQKIKIIFMICGPGSALLLMVRRVDLLSVEMNITSAIVMVASLIFFVPNLGAPWLFGINVSSKVKSNVGVTNILPPIFFAFAGPFSV